jgi:hypothetical protein
MATPRPWSLLAGKRPLNASFGSAPNGRSVAKARALGKCPEPGKSVSVAVEETIHSGSSLVTGLPIVMRWIFGLPSKIVRLVKVRAVSGAARGRTVVRSEERCTWTGHSSWAK